MTRTFNFDYWMALEKEYAAQEYSWSYGANPNYSQAERCHRLRWKCMDLALQSLEAE